MKIILRTLIILFAALLVVGATLAFTSSGILPTSGGRDGFERQPPAGFVEGQSRPGAPSGAEGSRRERGHEGGGMFSAFELLKNLVVMAVIIAFVSLFTQAGGHRRLRRR